MNPDYTHISLVVDTSSSMGVRSVEATDAIRSFLRDQFDFPGALTLSLVEFSHDVRKTHNMVAENVPDYTLNPSGMTALLDAVGIEIDALGAQLSLMPEEDRPSRVVFVVVTDGQENSSKEYKADQIRDMVNRQRDEYSWQFVFLGADDSAWAAESIGMVGTSYAGADGGTSTVYSTLSAVTTSYRSGESSVVTMPTTETTPAEV
jgi:hypothetical protein